MNRKRNRCECPMTSKIREFRPEANRAYSLIAAFICIEQNGARPGKRAAATNGKAALVL
jgi:hypothetical protein